MKSAEEWAKEISDKDGGCYDFENGCVIVNIDEIKQIQLDAWKQGMTDAANVVNQRSDNYDEEHGVTDPETGTREYPGTGEEYMVELDDIQSLILTARDNKTSL